MGSIDRNVGACLSERRKDFGMCEDEVAAAIGVAAADVMRFENGETRIDAITLLSFCRTLQMTPSDLYAECPRRRAALRLVKAC